MEHTFEHEKYSASIVRRALAFFIDAIVVFIPLLVVMAFFSSDYDGHAYYSPLFYATPIVGAASLYDVPIEANETINTFENDDGGVYYEHDYSLGATAVRVLSVFVILFYLFYSTVATVLYDGKTVGKSLMRIQVIAEDTEKPAKKIVLRELVGKVVLNSIPIFPLISIFTILFTPKHLAIHDMIFKTRVVE